jgi:hypothetical protein
MTTIRRDVAILEPMPAYEFDSIPLDPARERENLFR